MSEDFRGIVISGVFFLGTLIFCVGYLLGYWVGTRDVRWRKDNKH